MQEFSKETYPLAIITYLICYSSMQCCAAAVVYSSRCVFKSFTQLLKLINSRFDWN